MDISVHESWRARQRQALEGIFQKAVAAVDPQRVMRQHLPPVPPHGGRAWVLAVGKASAAMARAFDDAWLEEHPDYPITGIAITRYGHHHPNRRIQVVETSHPVPDQAGMEAAARVMETVQGLGENDRLIALISGGGSALMVAPAEGVSLEDKQEVTRDLLRCGATIRQINCVRRHLSRIKGGRLARMALPATVHSIIVSDVAGDHLCDIASGPTVPDPTTHLQAQAIIEQFGLTVPPSVHEALRNPHPTGATVAPDDPMWRQHTTVLMSSAQTMVQAVADHVATLGYQPLVLGDAIEGEARHVGGVLAAVVRQIAVMGQPLPPPVAIISGGETTVTVTNQGRGGRNAECLLGFANKLHELEPPGVRVAALAADTDGIDGTEDNAGAFSFSDTVPRMHSAGINPIAMLQSNDAYGAFAAVGDLLVTGSTKTNVNDLRVILVDAV